MGERAGKKVEQKVVRTCQKIRDEEHVGKR